MYVQVIFTSACAVFALVVWLLDKRDGRFQIQIWNVPLFSWLLVLTAIFPLLALSQLAVGALMKLLEVALSLFEHVHYILMGLCQPLRCCSCLFFSCACCNTTDASPFSVVVHVATWAGTHFRVSWSAAASKPLKSHEDKS
jgi:hypothetical protein